MAADDFPSGGAGSRAPRSPSKKRKRRLLTWIVSTVAVVFVFTAAGGILLQQNSSNVDAYAEARSALESRVETAEEVVSRAGNLEPTDVAAIQDQVETLKVQLDQDAPTSFSIDAGERSAELEILDSDLARPVRELNGAIEVRANFERFAGEAEEAYESADETWATTADKVLDAELHNTLKSDLSNLREILDSDVDETDGDSYEELSSSLTLATDTLSNSESAVKTDHSEWQAAEEEKARKKAEEEAREARKDPANYQQVSDRSWSLVERDPESHEGEEFVLYGRVTQADAITGSSIIRVDTSATQKSRAFYYDVNTMVNAGESGVFDDVVGDDLIKLLVTVDGSMSYETAIGGSTTAVEVTAYDIDVIGQA